MPEYRRSFIAGGTFFFKVVTYNRLPILTSGEARQLLRSAWENVRKRFPFAIDAVWAKPPSGRGDFGNIPSEMRRI